MLQEEPFLAYTEMHMRAAVDILYPTSILRPVYRYTVMSTARSEVRGTQRSERPATVVYYTVLYYTVHACILSFVMPPPPISTQLTVHILYLNVI